MILVGNIGDLHTFFFYPALRLSFIIEVETILLSNYICPGLQETLDDDKEVTLSDFYPQDKLFLPCNTDLSDFQLKHSRGFFLEMTKCKAHSQLRKVVC